MIVPIYIKCVWCDSDYFSCDYWGSLFAHIAKVHAGNIRITLEIMEKNLCSFQNIAGGDCGADPRDSTNKCEVVKLQSCLKDNRKHKRQYRIYGVETEIELILARANIFDQPRNLENLCICTSSSFWCRIIIIRTVFD